MKRVSVIVLLWFIYQADGCCGWNHMETNGKLEEGDRTILVIAELERSAEKEKGVLIGVTHISQRGAGQSNQAYAGWEFKY